VAELLDLAEHEAPSGPKRVQQQPSQSLDEETLEATRALRPAREHAGAPVPDDEAKTGSAPRPHSAGDAPDSFAAILERMSLAPPAGATPVVLHDERPPLEPELGAEGDTTTRRRVLVMGAAAVAVGASLLLVWTGDSAETGIPAPTLIGSLASPQPPATTAADELASTPATDGTDAPAVAAAEAEPRDESGTGTTAEAETETETETGATPTIEAAAELEAAAAELEATAVDDGEPASAAARKARIVDNAELVTRANQLRAQGELARAEQAYRQALRVFAYPRALAGMARLELLRGNAAAAVRWARRLDRRQPGRTANLTLLGDALRAAGRSADARDAYREAARRGGKRARARLSAEP
jgi:hypothetical protein